MWDIKKVNLFPVVDFVCSVITVLIFGLTFCMLWNWFIVKVFPLPILSYPLAVGVAITFELFVEPLLANLSGSLATLANRFESTARGEGEKERHWKTIWGLFKFHILFPLKCLAIGWFFHLFI